MKIKSSFYLLCALLLAFYSFSGNPPNGRTGAPGESTCAASGCHDFPNSNFSGSVVVSGLDNELVPGQMYNLTVTVTDDNLNAVRAGFQLTNVGPDEMATVGTFSNPSGNSTITPSGDRTYHEHSPAQVFSGGIATFTVDWTAPSSLTDGNTIDFYMASVIGNGSGSSNDIVVTNVVNTSMPVSSDPLEIALINSSDPLCNGDNNGMATIEITGGTPPYDILWPSGETETQATMLAAGINTVEVTDADLETISLDVLLDDPETILDNLIIAQDPNCADEASGSITVDPTGGTGNLILTWSTGENTNTISDLVAGDYNLDIVDQNGCTASFTYTLVDPDLIMDNLVGIQNPACAEDATGSITVLPTGGTGNLSLVWSTGENTNTISNLTAGIYTLQIVDEMNCVENFSYDVVGPAAVNASIVQESPLCFNSTGSLSVETDAVNPMFLWSNDAETMTITDVPTGDYTVTVTDESGCTAIASYSNPYVAEIAITFNVSGTAPPYTLQSNPSNGVEPYDFLWNTDETTQEITGLDNGTYTVTVNDFLGCSQVASIELQADCEFTVSDSIVNNLCAGDSLGAIYTMISSADGAEIEYLWNTGDTTSSIINLEAGLYSLTYTAELCTEILEFTISEPDPITTNFTIVQPTEQEPNSGSITVSATGGTAPLILEWFPGGEGNMIDSLEAGEYVLITTDQNGCQRTDTVILELLQCILDFSVSTDTIFCEGDLATASVIINSSLSDNLTIEWSTGDSTEVVSMLVPGNYAVSVFDSLGCMDSVNFAIQPHEDAIISIDSITTISCDDTLAFVEIDVSWNHGPFSYLWSNGDTTEVADSLLAGEISVIVTNTQGCIANDTFLIIEEVEEAPSIEVSTTTIYLDSMGNFEGSPAVATQLFGSCTDSLYATVDSLVASCSDLGDTLALDVFLNNYDQVIDTVQAAIYVVDTIAPYSSIGGDTVTLGAQLCGPGSVIINLELDSTNIFDNCPIENLPGEISLLFMITESKIYCDTVVIADASGNSTDIVYCIDGVIPTPIEVEIDVLPVTCFGGADGCIEIELSGGINPQVYADTLCPLPAGSYSVFIDDDTGCFFEELTVEVNQPAELIITEVDKMNETPGESDGFIDVEVSGGVEPYSYVWTENGVEISNVEDLVNYPSSQYVLTVTDANGCVTILNTFIDVVDAIFTPELSKIKVLENPFSNQLVLNNVPFGSNIRITNTTGSKMDQLRSTAETVSISSEKWPSGIYFVTIEVQGSIRSFKVIKL